MILAIILKIQLIKLNNNNKEKDKIIPISNLTSSLSNITLLPKIPSTPNASISPIISKISNNPIQPPKIPLPFSISSYSTTHVFRSKEEKLI